MTASALGTSAIIIDFFWAISSNEIRIWWLRNLLAAQNCWCKPVCKVYSFTWCISSFQFFTIAFMLALILYSYHKKRQADISFNDENIQCRMLPLPNSQKIQDFFYEPSNAWWLRIAISVMNYGVPEKSGCVLWIFMLRICWFLWFNTQSRSE